MTEPMITCPKCQTEIKLTESLAAPMIESARREYEQRLAQKDADIAKRELRSLSEKKSLSRQKRLSTIRLLRNCGRSVPRSSPKNPRKPNLLWRPTLSRRLKRLPIFRKFSSIGTRNLPRPRRHRLNLSGKQRELDDAKRELDLTVEKRVQDGLTATREQARKGPRIS